MAAQLDENIQYEDDGGNPLTGGEIYIGIVDLEPVANPKSIFSDRELTNALSNPQTIGSDGRVANKIWIDGKYSIRANNSLGVQQFIDLDAGKFTSAGTTSLSGVIGTNVITASASETITAYTDKEIYIFTVVSTNTLTGVTLNIDSVGAKSIVRNFDQSVVIGQFRTGQNIAVMYNSTNDNFEWVNPNRKVAYHNKGDDIASAATIDLSAARGNSISITGSTGPITSFGTTPAGTVFWLTFVSTPTITHNATSLLIPGQADLVIVSGDKVRVESLGSGNNQIDIFRNTGVALIATQAQMEADTDLTTIVTPGRVKHAPGVAKAWINFNMATAAILASYNIASITENGVGDFTIGFTVSFSSVNYALSGFARAAGTGAVVLFIKSTGTKTTSAMQVEVHATNGDSNVDATEVGISFFGDQ